MDYHQKQVGQSAVTASQERDGRLMIVGEVVLAVLTLLSVAAMVWQIARPTAVHFGGLTLDRISAAMTLLVAGVGLICYRFSIEYLDGDPRRKRFLITMFCGVVSAFLLMLATNLLWLFVFWSLTSMALHRLLTHCSDRVEAQRAAKKKFLISRLGDVALLAAIVVIWTQWNTLDLTTLWATLYQKASPESITTVALLVVIAALTKSAQFPFHSWLPETMESPTPVSALMHAGIINAGVLLLLRFAPVITAAPTAMLLLVVIGTLTAALGTVAMWAQVKVKRTLAWSTVAQMGFTMVQCGLGMFGVALLHVLGHGCYKAWSFLNSGEVASPQPRPLALSPVRRLLVMVFGTFVAVPILLIACHLIGLDISHNPEEVALMGVLALSIGQLWVAVFRSPGAEGGRNNALTRCGIALLFTCVASLLAVALYKSSAAYVAPVLGATVPLAGAWGWAAAVIPLSVFAALCVLYGVLPLLSMKPPGRAFHVHALHGFYFGSLADRVVATVWPEGKSAQPLPAAGSN